MSCITNILISHSTRHGVDCTMEYTIYHSCARAPFIEVRFSVQGLMMLAVTISQIHSPQLTAWNSEKRLKPDAGGQFDGSLE